MHWRWDDAVADRATRGEGANEIEIGNVNHCLAVTRRACGGGCTNGTRTNKEPGQRRPTRHSARPAEEHRSGRGIHAHRQIQLQTQRRPDNVWHLVSHMVETNHLLCSKAAAVPAPKVEVNDTDLKDKLVAALKGSFDFCSDALAKMDDSKTGGDNRRIRREASYAPGSA